MPPGAALKQRPGEVVHKNPAPSPLGQDNSDSSTQSSPEGVSPVAHSSLLRGDLSFFGCFPIPLPSRPKWTICICILLSAFTSGETEPTYGCHFWFFQRTHGIDDFQACGTGAHSHSQTDGGSANLGPLWTATWTKHCSSREELLASNDENTWNLEPCRHGLGPTVSPLTGRHKAATSVTSYSTKGQNSPLRSGLIRHRQSVTRWG